MNGLDIKKYIFALFCPDEPGAYPFTKPFYFSLRHPFHLLFHVYCRNKLAYLPAGDNNDKMED
jgi:hypothetical protein